MGVIHLPCFFYCPYRDEAEMEYLKIAQDLEMYGVSYFAITVSLDCYVLMFFKIGLILHGILTNAALKINVMLIYISVLCITLTAK